MSITFKFFHDSALTSEVTSGNPISATQDTAGSLDPVDVQIWLGSASSGVQVQATSDPGNDDIVISVADSAPASGEPDTAIKLATSQVGLDSAVAGDPLSVGTSITGGVGNAVSFWVRIDDATATVGTYTDLSLVTNDLTESAV